MADSVRARPSEQALAVPATPADAVDGPAGFDPSRIEDAVQAVEPKLLAPIIKRAAEDFYEQVLATAEDYLRDNLEWNLKSHLEMLERDNQRMRSELYDVDCVIGPPWLTHDERMDRLRSLNAKDGQLLALKYAVHEGAAPQGDRPNTGTNPTPQSDERIGE